MESLMIMRQNSNSVLFFIFGDTKTCSDWNRCSELGFCDFRERMSSLSLDLRSFGSSVFDVARSKVVLRGEGYTWTPIWWSSDNSKR